MSDFKVDDLVTIKADAAPSSLFGVIFKITKVNPKNIIAKPVVLSASPQGKGINYPAELLEKHDGEVPESGRLTSVSMPVPEFFGEGAVVTFKHPPTPHTTETPFIVTKDDGTNRLSVTYLGGGYSYRVARIGVTKHDLDWLGETLNPRPTAG